MTSSGAGQVQGNPERNTSLLAEHDELAKANRIQLPARSGGNWEVRGSPPLPLWIQIIDDALGGARLSLASIGAFSVPFPLAYRSPKVAGLPILDVKNRNTFWSFGEWNETMKRYSAIVYGVGEAFRNTEAALLQVPCDVGGVGIEYFGDIDPTGSRFLYCSTVRPLSGDVSRTSRKAISWFGPEVGPLVNKLWSEGDWMPQEAFGIEKLRSSMSTHHSTIGPDGFALLKSLPPS